MHEDTESWRKRLETGTRPVFERGEATRLTVPALTLVTHPDLRRVGERVLLPELVSGMPVSLSRLAPRFAQPGDSVLRPLAEPHLSRRPLMLSSEPDGGLRLTCRETPTAVVADGEPVREERVFSAEALTQGIVLLLAGRIVLLLHRVQPVVDRSVPRYGLAGENDSMLDLRRRIAHVAGLDVPVLLRGETGTGKELLAQAVHQASARRTGPYLVVNMGAVPSSLAAAELFGSVRGAFTGADRRRQGYFGRAHGGTLFLDEIAELPPEAQPLLLRVLENREIQPVGGEETLRVDVRTVAATDRNLEEAIEEGRFRAPLLHRLSGYEIRVPPLRERRDDVGRLFVHFLHQELEAVGEEHRLADPGPDGIPWLPATLMARLAAYSWPGNVRQLRNVARHLVVDSRGASEAQVGLELGRLLQGTEGCKPAAMEPGPAVLGKPRLYRSPGEISEGELLTALRANSWDPGATARQLRISRPSLYLLIDACPHTRKASDLEPAEIKAALARAGGRLAGMVPLLEVSEEGLKRRMKQLGLR